MDQYQQFWQNGYIIVDTQLSDATIDALVNSVQPYWADAKPHGSGYFDSNRIQDAWYSVPEVKLLATLPKILNLLKQLYGRTPLPFQTLNFKQGSEQPPHADSIHFNSEPFGYMCGVWVALEDISKEQGPLVYYPGSHKLDEINFEDANLQADYKYYKQYEDYVKTLIEAKNFLPRFGTIKKGQAIIWSANILHGGAEQTNRELTRYSQVTHYYFPRCRYWRPGESKDGRAYFDPWWIPYPHAFPYVSVSRTRSFVQRYWQRIRNKLS